MSKHSIPVSPAPVNSFSLKSYTVLSKSVSRPREMTYVYALICPITGEPFYVGKTNHPENRLNEHALNNPYYRELSLHSQEYEFRLEILEEYPVEQYQPFYETEWILEMLERGFHLRNAVFPTKLYPPHIHRLYSLCEKHGWKPQKNEYERWTMPDFGGAK